MKLRNKKTGKIIDLDYWTPYALGNEIGFENEDSEEYHYNSLAELCGKEEE